MPQDTQQYNEGDLMVVLITYNLGEAYIVAGRLEANDIPTTVVQEPAGSALGINIGSLGEIRLVVRAVDYDRALSILDDDVQLLEEDLDRVIYEDDDPDQ